MAGNLSAPRLAGRLLVKRPSQYADMLRRYRLYIDGRRVGTIKRSEELAFELPAGEHEIVARIDWCRSNFLSVTIREGATTEIEVGATARGARMLGAWYYITFGRAEYLYLKMSPRGFQVLTPDESGKEV